MLYSLIKPWLVPAQCLGRRTVVPRTTLSEHKGFTNINRGLQLESIQAYTVSQVFMGTAPMCQQWFPGCFSSTAKKNWEQG